MKYYTPTESELYEAIIYGQDVYFKRKVIGTINGTPIAPVKTTICFHHLSDVTRKIQWFLESLATKDDNLFSVDSNDFELKYLIDKDVENLGWEYKHNGFSNVGDVTYSQFQRGDYYLILTSTNFVTVWRHKEDRKSFLYRGFLKSEYSLANVLDQVLGTD